MVTRAEWYTRVNAEWPDEDYPTGLPPLTFEEATKAARKLYRFATGKTLKTRAQFMRTSGNRRNNFYSRKLNPDEGWKALVHHLSHVFYTGPHGGEHARMEIRLIKEVVRRGWLTGSLKAEPKPAKPAHDQREEKLARLRDRITRWESKERRAANALKKLRAQLRRAERAKEKVA